MCGDSFSARRTFSSTLAWVSFLIAVCLFPAQVNGQNTWQEVAKSPPSARYDHAMAYDSGRSKVVLFGGYNGSNRFNDTWEWSGKNWIKKTPANKPSKRYAHAMVYDSARGVVVLFGGLTGSGTSNETWEWNGTNWSKKTPATSPPARDAHAMAYDSANNEVVLFGGYDGSNNLSDTWVWNGTNWSQKSPASPPPERHYHAMANDSGRGRVVLFGGFDGTNRFNDTWEWNGSNWSQKSPASPPVKRYGHAMAYDSANGKVVLFGGFVSGYRADTWEWDGTTWIKKIPANKPARRTLLAMAYDSSRNGLVLFGGNKDPKLYDDTWVWNGTNWTLKSASVPSARSKHAMAYDSSRSKAVLFGGGTDLIPTDETWEWAGTTWAQRTPASAPTARRDHAMAFDSDRSVVVLFGGWSGSLNGETWEWSGSNWAQRTTSTQPSTRRHHAMAYDSARGVVVLFGGWTGSPNDETWEWDSTNWSPKSPAAKPSARSDHAMAYDSARGKVVLFGGEDSTSKLNDTWEWDGTNWSPSSPASPPPARVLPSLAYDSDRSVVVLFGGEDNSGKLSDTWEWDGTNWTNAAPGNSPSARSAHAIVYDAANKNVVLFGGEDSPSYMGDTWLYTSSANSTPSTVSVNPSSGSGISQTFVATYRDEDGAADLKQVLFMVNSSQSGANGAFMLYMPGPNKIYLRNNAGTAWSTGAVLGSALVTLSNSQVSLDVSGAGVSTSGNDLELTLPLTFTAAFAGNKNVYMKANDQAGATSGWNQKGTYTVASAGATPLTVSVSPSSGSGSSQTFVATYRDGDGATDLKQVYFLVKSSLGGANAAYLLYKPVTNKIFLRNDAGSAWSAGAVPGSALITLSNSQVSIDISQVNVSTLDYDFGTDMLLTLPLEFKAAFVGSKNVYMRAVDKSAVTSGWNQKGTYTVSFANQAPITVSVSPDSGSGKTQTFEATYRDTNGASDLDRVYFLVNSSLGGANGAYILYRPGVDKIHLRNDAGSGWSAGKTPGSAVTLKNSQVKVFVAGVSVSTTGSDMKLTLPVTFRPGFGGAKKVFMRAYDSVGADSGWNQKGIYTVAFTNQPPILVSLSPTSGSGTNQRFVATYRDTNGASDLNRVYFLVNSSLLGSNGVYVLYRPGVNKIHLRTDSGSAWSGGKVLGTAVTLHNSQVKIKVLNASVSSTGSELQLTIPLVFKSAFAGDKNVYMKANDKAAATSGWSQMGIYTVNGSPAPPSALSEALVFGHRDVAAGETQLFSIDAPPYSEVIWSMDGLVFPGDEVLYAFDSAGLYDIGLLVRHRDGHTEYSSALLEVDERLLMAGDLETLTEEQALVTASGRVKAKHLFESIEEPVIIRLRGEMVPGLRLAFNRTDPGNYQFLELRETEDLEGWLWCVGEVVNGEETVLAERTMESRSGSLTLALELDPDSGQVVAKLNGRGLFEEPVYSDLRGGVSLLPPETRIGLDVIISRPAR